MLRSDLKEQVTLGGKWLGVYEADRHEQHERGEIDQESKSVGSLHESSQKSRLLVLTSLIRRV
jgi:hypothetical protein